MLTRKNDWPERLAAVVRAAAARPFEWGRQDCALFACDCIAAMTGADPAAAFRGRYRTARGAARALRRIAGVDDLGALATKVLGAPVAPAFARRGDIAEVPLLDGPGFGVVLGREVAVVGVEGLLRVSMQTATRAWRVG